MAAASSPERLQLAGVFTALVTPFTQDGSAVNYAKRSSFILIDNNPHTHHPHGIGHETMARNYATPRTPT